jgi:chemotaxis protein methyltransferase WspC
VHRDPFEAILAERIGLDAASIGHDEVARAVRRRVEATGCEDTAAYLARLVGSDTEWEELAELVLVPETWFFREPTAFDLLAARAALHASSGSRRRFSVLSLPCATGEEPYSAAMTLLDVGLIAAQFRVEAIDVSRRAIEAAREATYSARSVARAGPVRRQRFFEEADDLWRVRDDVRQLVRFSRGNLVDPQLLAGAAPFDVVFCRNVLIYLSGEARLRLLATLSRLVRPDGVLLTGHAEPLRLVAPAFASARVPRTFAWVPSAPGGNQARPALHAGRAVRQAAVSPSAARAERALPGAAPPDAAALLAQATRLADAGHLEQARAVVGRVILARPGEAPGYYLAGIIASGLGRHADAEAALRRAVYLDPRHAEALQHLAFLRARHGDAAEAERLRLRASLARARNGGDVR